MKILVKNKKISFDYEIIDTLDAGLVLLGHEVKALKTQGANIRDALVTVTDNELWIVNLDIPLYKKVAWSSLNAYDPKGRRKLLVTKKQLTKLRERTQKTGLHIVPTKIFEANNGTIKITIGLAKRKKNIQKRQAIKDKDTARQMDKQISTIIKS